MRDVVQAPAREVEGAGYAEEATFTIQADEKMFRILINGLYADKPRAIIRELWSNAFDSHAQAGTPDRPFECHLPTRFAPHFSVRDFGVSLTHDQVMGLYTTVGKSTKEMTNLAVGKFGLGSKTPFAYTDQFSVTCWLNGEKRLYNAFIDSTGIPKIALFHTEETTEENGVEVSFPVQPQDCDAFLRAAKTTLLGFDIAPVLTGARIDLDRDLGKVVFSGNGWVLRRGEYGAYGNRAHVKQGCVVYPLDTGALSSKLSGEPGLLHLVNSGLIFDVPIGSVDITPSRESLSYDATTISNIIERLKSIRAEIEAPFTSAVKDGMKMREAMQAYSHLFEDAGKVLPRPMVEDLQRRVMWRGKRVSSFFGAWSFNPQSARIKVIKVGYAPSGRTKAANCPRTFTDAFVNSHISRTWAEPAPIFVVQAPGEKVSYAGARVANFVRERKQGVFWVQGGEREVKRLLVLFRRPEKFEVVRLADLENPITAGGTGPREKGKVTMRRYVDGGWKDEKVAVDAGGLAFFQDNGRIWDKDGTKSIHDASDAAEVVALLIEAGAIEKDDSIYLVPSRCRKSVMKNIAAWDCALSYACEAAEQGWTEKDADNEAGEDHKRSISHNIDSIHRCYVDHVKRSGMSLPADAPSGKLLAAINALGEADDRDDLPKAKEAARKLCRKLGVNRSGRVSPEVAALEQAALSAQEAFDKAYPLFSRSFRWNLSGQDAKLAHDYIALVDNAAALAGAAQALAPVEPDDEAEELAEAA